MLHATLGICIRSLNPQAAVTTVFLSTPIEQIMGPLHKMGVGQSKQVDPSTLPDPGQVFSLPDSKPSGKKICRASRAFA